MGKRAGISTTYVFLTGIAIGVVASLLFSIILSRSEPGMLTNRPKTFGNIKIWVQKPLVTKDEEVPEGFNHEYAKELLMTNDDVVFLRISQSQTGEVSCLYLLKNNKEPVFYMKPWNTPSGWGRATYSKSSGSGYATGEVFIDIDFDGRFDFKMFLDNEGRLISRSIYIDGSWLEIEHANIVEMRAALGQAHFAFDPDIGRWQAE